MPRDARFCPACGVRVIGARPGATAEVASAPAPEPSAPAAAAPVDARALVADMRQLKSLRSSSIVANVLVFVAVLLVFLVFTRAWNAGKPKEASMFGGGGAPPAAGLAEPEPGTAAPGSDVRPIRGSVSVAPGAEAGRGTLFVVVRNANSGERGPPLAVQRFEAPSFPLAFEVGPAQVMMPGMPFTGPFDVTARLDSDGNAMTRDAADLVSPAARGVTVGQEGLALVLGAPAGDAAATPGASASAAPSNPPASASAAPSNPPAATAVPTTSAPGLPGRVTGRVVAGPDVSPVGAGALYVVLRVAGSPDKGPPLAVRKYDAGAIPLTFDLGPEHVMLQGMPFQGPFDVYARVDRDGDAATRTPGDLEVTRPAAGVALGGVSADVVLDRRR